jgi:pimeloyl-ACP methyl ester carboxylesterase
MHGSPHERTQLTRHGRLMKAIHTPPVLLVPGALNGAWVWQDNFQPFFETAGFEVHTFEFPSHSARGMRRQALSLADYRQYLADRIAGFAKPPILIAHSLGGLVSLHVMHLVPVSAVALLSPVPPDGVLRSMVSMTLRSPISAVKMLAVIAEARFALIASAPFGMHSDTSDPEGVTWIAGRLRSESLLALTQAIWQRLPHAPAPVPLHFFGATGDHIIPAEEVRRAADLYGAPVTIYEGMSHAFQVERDWAQIAGDILRWLSEEGLVVADAKGSKRGASKRSVSTDSAAGARNAQVSALKRRHVWATRTSPASSTRLGGR